MLQINMSNPFKPKWPCPRRLFRKFTKCNCIFTAWNKIQKNHCLKTIVRSYLMSWLSLLPRVDEFHYLNVPRVGTFTAYDEFDCTFKCLRNHLCFSVNLAASNGRADGKLWCELLSGDKFSNSENYNRNSSSHHFSNMVVFLFVLFFSTTCISNTRDNVSSYLQRPRRE